MWRPSGPRFVRALHQVLGSAPVGAVIIVPTRQQQRYVQALLRRGRPYSQIRVVCPYTPAQLTWLRARHVVIVRGLPADFPPSS